MNDDVSLGGHPDRRRAALVLASFALLLCVQRLHTYNEPLERDLSTYAVIADSLLDGRALYSDLWDHKPPAIHLTYAAAQMIAGYGPASVYLLWVTAATATLLGVYFAAFFWIGSRAHGLVAAAFWTAIMSPSLRSARRIRYLVKICLVIEMCRSLAHLVCTACPADLRSSKLQSKENSRCYV